MAGDVVERDRLPRPGRSGRLRRHLDEQRYLGLASDRRGQVPLMRMSQLTFLQREWAAVFEAASKDDAEVHAGPRTACSTLAARRSRVPGLLERRSGL